MSKFIPLCQQREILLRLPLKSVIRFRLVQKAWDDFIKEEKFAMDYWNRHENDEDGVLVHKDQISMLFRDKEKIICPSSKSLQIVGCVRGIVCLRNGRKYCLWNPVLHQSVEFTIPPMFPGMFTEYHVLRSRVMIVGLGFDCMRKEYKVIVCYELKNSTVVGMFYNSRHATWKRLKVPDYLVNPVSNSDNNLDYSSPCVTTNENLYWAKWSWMTGHGQDEAFSELRIVKFTVATNEFNPLPMFQFPSFGAHHRITKLKDNLCVLRCESGNDKRSMLLNVYCLDKDDEFGVWTLNQKIGPIDLDRVGPRWILLQGFRCNNEIILQKVKRRIGNEGITEGCGAYLLYDVISATDKFVQGCTTGEFKSCYSYTPSLALVTGMHSAYVDSQDLAVGGWPKYPWRMIHSLGYLSGEEEGEEDADG